MHALVDVHDATQRFRARVALDRFSISIEEGTVVGILGPNGAGKTTLINVVAGLSRPTAGAISWRGAPVA
jgi:branched-chain amino acid transport system ATP-binding protein